MKKQPWMWLVSGWMMMAIASTAFALEDGILAIVNDEIITLKDLKDHIRSTYAGLMAEGRSEEELQQIVLNLELNGINNLVENRLILSRATSIGLEVREQLIDDRIEEIKERYQSEKEFIQALVQNGSNLTELRNKIRSQLQMQYVIDYEVKSKIYVSPREVTEYYQSNQDRFQSQSKIFLKSIFLGFQDNDKEEVRLKAQETLNQIKLGSSFDEMIKTVSDMPSIDSVEKGQLMPKVEDEIFKLSENEVSDLIEVDNGIYIFKVTGRKEATTYLLEDVKDKIHQVLFQNKYKKRMSEWINELKQDAYVEIKQ